ncbi:Uncharacterised protein [Mycobacteroides abscessus subsp. abscessus]|nr:Uncharacterised protein [Mycobacteroides abscessus subsp. abscessus]
MLPGRSLLPNEIEAVRAGLREPVGRQNGCQHRDGDESGDENETDDERPALQPMHGAQ